MAEIEKPKGKKGNYGAGAGAGGRGEEVKFDRKWKKNQGKLTKFPGVSLNVDDFIMEYVAREGGTLTGPSTPD